MSRLHSKRPERGATERHRDETIDSGKTETAFTVGKSVSIQSILILKI
jgi:hypothetical protein